MTQRPEKAQSSWQMPTIKYCLREPAPAVQSRRRSAHQGSAGLPSTPCGSDLAGRHCDPSIFLKEKVEGPIYLLCSAALYQSLSIKPYEQPRIMPIAPHSAYTGSIDHLIFPSWTGPFLSCAADVILSSSLHLSIKSSLASESATRPELGEPRQGGSNVGQYYQTPNGRLHMIFISLYSITLNLSYLCFCLFFFLFFLFFVFRPEARQVGLMNGYTCRSRRQAICQGKRKKYTRHPRD